MELKNRNVEELLVMLQSTSEFKNTKFNYFRLKNYDKLIKEYEHFQKMFEIPDGFKEYDQERIKLLEEVAEKDDDGKAVIENNAYKIADKETWDVKFKELQDTHSEDIIAYSKMLDEKVKFMNEPLELDLHGIKLENLPEDLEDRQLRLLVPLILDWED